MEQPEAIENTIRNRIVGGMPDFTADGVPDTLYRVRAYLHRSVRNRNARGTGSGTGARQVHSSHAH